MFGFKKRRRNRLVAQQFPAEWMAIIERNVPYYRLLPEADQKELQSHIQIFIDEKRFEGCGGLKITDEIKVTIGPSLGSGIPPVIRGSEGSEARWRNCR